MLVECNYCGAPLDVREGARLTKCRYCGTVDERTKLKTVAVATPKEFRPPPRWVPPAHVPADSALELKYKKSNAGWVVAIVLLALFAVPVVLIVRTLASAAGVGAPGGPELLAVKLAQGPKGLGEALSANNAAETSVYVTINSDKYDYVTISWNEKHLDHPAGFYFSAKKDTQFDPQIRRSLTQALHCDLDSNGGWRWEHVYINVDLKTGAIGGNVEADPSTGAEPNPLWKRQIAALWQVVVAAIYNLKAGPSEAEARELLGVGYPFRDLARLDPNTSIENARPRVEKLFPGSVFSMSSELTGYVALDHPLFHYVELNWNNKKGAIMNNAGFRSRPDGYEGRHDAVATCLGKTFGPPIVNETDYMKGKKDYRFELKDTTIYVSSSYLYTVGPLDAALWQRFIGALAQCGK